MSPERLKRLLAAAAAGRSGVNLAAMSDEEALKILSRREQDIGG